MKKIEVADKVLPTLVGTRDSHLKFLQSYFQVEISARGREITLKGDEAREAMVADFIMQLSDYLSQGHSISDADLAYVARVMEEQGDAQIGKLLNGQIRPSARKSVSPRSPNQNRYMDAIRENDMVFGIGPAGTGKTYLAVAMALMFLKDRKVERIILARPAVEAGEKLGFLPGDMAQKVEPYLRPLYDAIFDFHMKEEADRLVERGIIEIAPLAFMRGRTLNDSFIILDEAQNTTSEQMKMFLTRIGFNSKAVITGDVTQIDLPAGRMSGLVEAEHVVSKIPGISIVRFDDGDVVRHPLVQRIIVAYETFQGARPGGGRGAPASPASPVRAADPQDKEPVRE
ncbi:MAG TPA: PhoH family protein [Patescibacteria group bacterium]|jgi:phosphate starvation-inducible PhoH-like protein|nr:PhoH family protein [Patescibacteria group bacterium]